MRHVIVAAAFLATVVAGTAFAQDKMGNEEKYCTQMKSDPGDPPRCTYKTMAQRQETVKSDMGTCIENPKLKGKM
jgi:hypothetical protein